MKDKLCTFIRVFTFFFVELICASAHVCMIVGVSKNPPNNFTDTIYYSILFIVIAAVEIGTEKVYNFWE